MRALLLVLLLIPNLALAGGPRPVAVTGGTGGGGGGNAAASTTGAAVPTSADYTGFNSGGLLVGVSLLNPLPVSAAQSGTWTLGRSWSLSSGTDSVNIGNFPATQIVSWSGQSVSVSNFPAIQGVSWTGQSVSVSNFPSNQTVTVSGAATPTLTQVSATTTSTSLLAANSSRRKCILYNDGSVIAYVAYGATATTAAYSFQLKPLAYYECGNPVYTGAISAITASGTATVKVTEVQ